MDSMDQTLKYTDMMRPTTEITDGKNEGSRKFTSFSDHPLVKNRGIRGPNIMNGLDKLMNNIRKREIKNMDNQVAEVKEEEEEGSLSSVSDHKIDRTGITK